MKEYNPPRRLALRAASLRASRYRSPAPATRAATHHTECHSLDYCEPLAHISDSTNG